MLIKKHGLFLSQKKYALDLPEETDLLGCKPACTSVEANVDLCCDSIHPLDDIGQYRRFIVKLMYLTITRSEITFAV